MARMASKLSALAAVCPGALLCLAKPVDGEMAGLWSSTTQSLFEPADEGSIGDLVSNQTVGSLFGAGQTAHAAMFFDDLTAQQQKSIIDRAYPNLAVKWDDTTLFVCWETTETETSADRALVRQAVEESWAAASALAFEGWGDCQEASVGIRIAVRDVGPYTARLGKDLDGLKDGVILNFSYNAWETGCRRTEALRQYCTRTTAVHEFGHAIGFSHEQNRPDTPADCSRKARPQGEDGTDTEMTPWDPHSVMNYCNVEYLNNGALSDFDKQAVREIYGARG